MNAARNTPSRREVLLSSEELNQLLAISSDLENERTAFVAPNTHHIYMKFLQISMANTSSINLWTLTLNEQHLLEQAAVRSEMGDPINVNEACDMSKLGSIASVHRLLQKLIDMGLVVLTSEQNERREKVINLSPKGLDYFKQIEDCLDAALISQ